MNLRNKTTHIDSKSLFGWLTEGHCVICKKHRLEHNETDDKDHPVCQNNLEYLEFKYGQKERQINPL